MELHGSNYLYTLALLGLAFASVSALIMILRQIMGGAMSKFDVVITRNFIFCGFTAAIDPMLPPLLDLFSPIRSIVWPFASLFQLLGLSQHFRRKDGRRQVFGCRLR